MTTATASRHALAFLFAVAALIGCTGGYDVDPLDPSQNWYQPFDLLTFNVANDDYRQLMTQMADVLLDPRGGAVNLIDNRIRVLHRQDVKNRPFRWIILELIGAGDNRTMLAIRQDNVYINGFTDRLGNWYGFSNRPRWLIPVARPFRSFSDDYSDLLGSYRSIRYVRTSKKTTLEAVDRIASYDPSDVQADVGCVARALGVMAVTFAEATRFWPYHQMISNNWEGGADMADLFELAVKWRVISCALMISEQEHGSWNSLEVADLRRDTKIQSRDDALNALRIALWPWRELCSETITWLRV